MGEPLGLKAPDAPTRLKCTACHTALAFSLSSKKRPAAPIKNSLVFATMASKESGSPLTASKTRPASTRGGPIGCGAAWGCGARSSFFVLFDIKNTSLKNNTVRKKKIY
jgi:hypothetical protein